MWELIGWLIFVGVAIGLAIIVVRLVAKPMRAMLGANSYMKPGQSFYVRAFGMVIYLSTLAVVVRREFPSPEEKFDMEYVWWVADGLEPAFWSMSLFLLGFVVLLTIVFAVLGRYRDK